MLLSLSLSALFHPCVRPSHYSTQGLTFRAQGVYPLSAAAIQSLSGLSTGAKL